MNIRQLQFFYRAARAGNFSATARAEGVTVQAVSKSMHELEEELGGQLFEREGRRMRLTPLGEALLEPARRAVESFESVGQLADALSKGPAHRSDLRLALITPPFSKHEFICGIVARLMTQSLGIKTSLSVRIGAEALTDLHAGNLDALFTIGRLSAPGCTCVQIGTVAPGVFLICRFGCQEARRPQPDRIGPGPLSYGSPRRAQPVGVSVSTHDCKSDIRVLANAFRRSGWGCPRV